MPFRYVHPCLAATPGVARATGLREQGAMRQHEACGRLGDVSKEAERRHHPSVQ